MEHTKKTSERKRDVFRDNQYYFLNPKISEVDSDMIFSDKDIEALRDLAKQVAEIADSDEMREKSRKWTKLHDLESCDPVIYVDAENGWNEILTDNMFVCEEPLARTWENLLRKDIYSATEICDDRVITKNFDVPIYWTDDGFGIDPIIDYANTEGGSYHILPAIADYEEDMKKLHFPTITVNREKTKQLMELAQDVFGDIFNCRFYEKWQWDDSFLDRYVQLRGMEDFMCDFILEPENVKRVMKFMVDGSIQRFRWLESHDLLFLNNTDTYLGTGGQGNTTDLPAEDFQGRVRTKDIWLSLQAQETVSVDPQMFGEIILPEFKRLAEHFGLVHYGCCEPFDKRWEYIKQIPNLRHVSVSPWARYSAVPEMLGKDYVASVKLKPTPLAMPSMNEEYVRRECRRAVSETYGGICEFIMKDNHTIGNNPDNLIQWVRIMRESIEEKY